MGRPTEAQRMERLGVHLDAEKIYTLSEAAKLLRVNVRTVTKAIKSGAIRAGRIGRRYYVSGAAILDAVTPESAAANE